MVMTILRCGLKWSGELVEDGRWVESRGLGSVEPCKAEEDTFFADYFEGVRERGEKVYGHFF